MDELLDVGYAPSPSFVHSLFPINIRIIASSWSSPTNRPWRRGTDVTSLFATTPRSDTRAAATSLPASTSSGVASGVTATAIPRPSNKRSVSPPIANLWLANLNADWISNAKSAATLLLTINLNSRQPFIFGCSCELADSPHAMASSSPQSCATTATPSMATAGCDHLRWDTSSAVTAYQSVSPGCAHIWVALESRQR